MMVATSLKYMSGFGNHFASEALPNSLPIGQNSPQKAPRGLYAEQLSGTAFSALRHENLRSWLYRIQPSVTHGAFKQVDRGLIRNAPFEDVPPNPNQMRWDPVPLPSESTDFVQGLVTIAGNGFEGAVRGCAAHIYAANKSMDDRFMYNSDGEFLFVPELGDIRLCTEFGIIQLTPGEIAVIPRGVKFQVKLLGETARGYVLENYGPALRLPHLGVIGANGLANPRDFQTPHASYEKRSGNFKLLNKFGGNLYEADIDHSPLDVVAWHGNYVPYKYDLQHFNVLGSISYDHPDPSIFTVLTSPSELPGIANVDFVVFPPRWLVGEHTFRPPYYHRNVMSEYMGLIRGVYDAKAEGFVPGGASLHNAMSAHGPDCATFEKASNAELKPMFVGDTMAFMFETSLTFRLTEFALNSPIRQKNYQECWKDLKPNFDETP